MHGDEYERLAVNMDQVWHLIVAFNDIVALGYIIESFFMKSNLKIYSPALLGLLGLIAAYVFGAFILSHHLGVAEQFTFLLYSKVVVQVSIMLFLLFLGWRVWSLIIFQRPKHLTITLIRDVRDRLFTPEQLRQAVPIFAGFIFFISAFTAMKGMIPLVQSYQWDEMFSEWDRLIHFGIDPWRLLQPVFGHAWITAGLNIIYNLWFVVMFAVLYWQLFDLRRAGLRMQFFWTFFLSWMVNGTVLAMVFSSAGPCFYDHLVHSINPYMEQMNYLRDMAGHYPVWAVETQEKLWSDYSTSTIGMGSGISAMPSVHVAIAMLFVLLGWQYGRWSRIFFCTFGASIMIGSVHLGWHYAIDGYAGALVTILIWWMTGKIFKRVRV